MDEKNLKDKLSMIYSLIPDFECKHCHNCCGPIIWFKPEDVVIRGYLFKHKINFKPLSTDEFKQNDMICPFLKNDKCSIYPVRPLVCRLQGVEKNLVCIHGNKRYLSKKEFEKIRKKFNELLEETNSKGVFYGTHKL